MYFTHRSTRGCPACICSPHPMHDACIFHTPHPTCMHILHATCMHKPHSTGKQAQPTCHLHSRQSTPRTHAYTAHMPPALTAVHTLHACTYSPHATCTHASPHLARMHIQLTCHLHSRQSTPRTHAYTAHMPPALTPVHTSHTCVYSPYPACMHALHVAPCLPYTLYPSPLTCLPVLPSCSGAHPLPSIQDWAGIMAGQLGLAG